jgi:hypothetical protein
VKGCSSGKTKHSSIANVRIYARTKARRLNREGTLVMDIYAYRCPECKHWHVTIDSEWNHRPNLLVFEAPDEALQRWAMTGEEPDTER